MWGRHVLQWWINRECCGRLQRALTHIGLLRWAPMDERQEPRRCRRQLTIRCDSIVSHCGSTE